EGGSGLQGEAWAARVVRDGAGAEGGGGQPGELGADGSDTERAAAPRPARRKQRPVEGRVGVEEFLPGGEWRDAEGAVYVHERLRSDIEKPRPRWGRLGEPPAEEADLTALAALGLGRALFLDLETGGLASSPGFLAGPLQGDRQG